MFCQKCGKEIKEGFPFCSSCGEKVAFEAPENGNYAVATESNNKKIIIACVLVVLLVVIITVGSIIASASKKAALEEKNERLKEICIEAVQRISLDEISYEQGVYTDMSLTLGYAIQTIDDLAIYKCELGNDGNPNIVTVEFLYYTYEEDPDYCDIYHYTFLVETVEYEDDVLTTTIPYLQEIDSSDFGHLSFDTYILESIFDLYYNTINASW